MVERKEGSWKGREVERKEGRKVGRKERRYKENKEELKKGWKEKRSCGGTRMECKMKNLLNVDENRRQMEGR